MKIHTNISLKKYNTFGIEANARFFCEVNSIDDLMAVFHLKEYPNKFIISGGSNMLITSDIDALVVYINLKGIDIISETEDHVVLKVMAGEVWHDLVIWSLEQNYGGLENLSLIPGKTGTAPIQNIGAYGVELKDSFVSCEAFNVKDRSIREFSKTECEFGYRDSYFKNEGKGRFIIISVTLKLTRRNHRLDTSYGAIENELQKMKIASPSIKDISDAVVTIRNSKLPDPKILGNSGSFFKNPVLNEPAFEAFIKDHPQAKYYKLDKNSYKIPAGWLIEQCGFKGERFGDAGVHKNQALVLVNHGNATGSELLDLAKTIIKSVKERFNIAITPEVNIIK